LPVIWHFDWTIFDGFVSLLTWILASVFSESWLNNGVFVTLNWLILNLFDFRRTNVALTRARNHLLIVGNENNLRKNQLWRQIIQQCKGKERKNPAMEADNTTV
jgi:superfamily I DNA and/or RNA helicase